MRETLLSAQRERERERERGGVASLHIAQLIICGVDKNVSEPRDVNRVYTHADQTISFKLYTRCFIVTADRLLSYFQKKINW